jgi:formyltetrahydrofolate synthetase
MEILSVIESANNKFSLVVDRMIEISSDLNLNPRSIRLARFYDKNGQYYAIIYYSKSPKDTRDVAKFCGLDPR